MGFKKNCTPWNKGQKTSKGVRKKLSEAHVGKKHSAETRKKISKANKGKDTWCKGKKLSKETRIKMGKSRIGKKNHNWKGGCSHYPLGWTGLLKESIRKRDNYICQECGIHQDELRGRNKKLDCHHIDYNKENLNPKNLISLCRKCHLKTNFDREYWYDYFKGGEIEYEYEF